MIAVIIEDVAAILPTLLRMWSRSGVTDAVPTGQVLAGLAPISRANRRIVLQEWLAEAFTMWGVPRW
jgi:hypothetical protein